LEQKKRDLELIQAENTMIECKNMNLPSQKLGTARATSHTAVPIPRVPFAAFCFLDKLPISLFLTQSPWFLVQHFNDLFLTS